MILINSACALIMTFGAFAAYTVGDYAAALILGALAVAFVVVTVWRIYDAG